MLDLLPKESTRHGKLLRRMLPFAIRAQRQILGREDLELNAAAAVVALTNPELFENQEAAIDIETEGTVSQGAAVFDRRNVRQWRGNIEVLAALDANGVRDCILRSLNQAGAAG